MSGVSSVGSDRNRVGFSPTKEMGISPTDKGAVPSIKFGLNTGEFYWTEVAKAAEAASRVCETISQ
jgi:hypothetical protein